MGQPLTKPDYEKGCDTCGHYYIYAPPVRECSSTAIELIYEYDVDYVCFGRGPGSIDWYICPTCKKPKWVAADTLVGSPCLSCSGPFGGLVMGAWNLIKMKGVISPRRYLAVEAMKVSGMSDKQIANVCGLMEFLP